MDQLTNIYNKAHYMLPIVTFIIGLMGSIHCSTMCGAFVLISSDTKRKNFLYQLGRLSSYLILGSLLYMFGSILKLEQISEELSIIAGILLSFCFIYIGLKGLRKSELRVKLPRIFDKYIQIAWKKLLSKRKTLTGFSFFVGALSILLPCGLLYSVLLPIAAVNSFSWVLLSVVSFWFGTLPIMGLAPIVFKKIIQPLNKKAPTFISLFFILFGVLTLGIRVLNVKNVDQNNKEVQICH